MISEELDELERFFFLKMQLRNHHQIVVSFDQVGFCLLAGTRGVAEVNLEQLLFPWRFFFVALLSFGSSSSPVLVQFLAAAPFGSINVAPQASCCVPPSPIQVGLPMFGGKCVRQIASIRICGRHREHKAVGTPSPLDLLTTGPVHASPLWFMSGVAGPRVMRNRFTAAMVRPFFWEASASRRPSFTWDWPAMQSILLGTPATFDEAAAERPAIDLWRQPANLSHWDLFESRLQLFDILR